jgi:hypothetical protein
VQFRKAAGVPIDASDTKHIQPVLGESTGLVKTDDVDLATDVNAIRRDAENALLPQSLDRKGCADRQRRGQSWWNDDGDQIESAEHDCLPFNLSRSEKVN